ncbi:PHP domain-containing protein [Halobacillus shinanisalinarum]|uniref:PHP domain-containing protein n=1 Tax=Halobacillus shinanisalinarum TaxID=2932258 RepID=A0ABY4H2V5_9BACI|nr:PHP domain-containing protein [Halobacillus shinanisalinarum]UOQ94689.1 PHP domain-containing protein [Halobacillus shinanisalinarum]
MKADLHVHSHYSDGSDSVEEVIKQAKANGVTHISFVDHDTVDGLPEIIMLGEKYGLEIIPGIEISAYDYKRDRKVHVLGYHYHPEALHIKSVCQPILERRQQHSLWQIRQINKAGYKLNAEAIMETAWPCRTIYKQHIMNHLTGDAYASPEYKELYKRLFKNGGVASGDIKYVDAFAAVEAIVADGGMAVVAHPGQLESYEMIPELVEAGLEGVERNHPDHAEEDHQKVEALAKQYNLVMTGGTDYHGSFGASIEIGSLTSPSLWSQIKEVR